MTTPSLEIKPGHFLAIPAAYAGVVLIWATTPLTIKWSSNEVGFLFAVLGRMAIGVGLCLLLLKWQKIILPWDRAALRTYAAAAVGIYGAMLSVYWGAQFIPSGLIAVLFGLVPLMTGVMAARQLGESSFTLPKLTAMLLGLFGLVLIFKSDLTLQFNAAQGIAAVLFAVFLHSLSLVLVKQTATALPALAVTGGSLVLVTPLYFFTWLVFDGQLPVDIPMRAGLSIVYLGIFGSVMGFVLFFYLIHKLETGKTALITLITPVLALFLGQILNNEDIPADVWWGTSCIVIALVIYQWGANWWHWLRRPQV